MEAEALAVRIQSIQSARSARMCEPGTGCDRVCYLRDDPIGDAEEDELCLADVELPARGASRDALAQAGGNRLADAARADHAC